MRTLESIDKDIAYGLWLRTLLDARTPLATWYELEDRLRDLRWERTVVENKANKV